MSKAETAECINCHTPIKYGIFGSVTILPDPKVNVINEYSENKAPGYCTKCSSDKYISSISKLEAERELLQDSIRNLIGYVPIVTTHSPYKWEYEILGMVTGQSTTGTGVISEFTSSFSDFFGAQSGRYNRKLKAGENLCASQLRMQTIDLGGNAIIATDIDYSEIGTEKGMLMVCMAGTAIKLTNLEILGIAKGQLQKLYEANKRENYLGDLKNRVLELS